LAALPYIQGMTRWLAPLFLVLALGPAQAQETEETDPGLMKRGAELFLRGLMNEIGPELNQMQDSLRDLQPELQKLVELMGDFRNYEMPEKLPNGDILIRRKPDLHKPPILPEGPEIEL
jgi:hypothetical protein